MALYFHQFSTPFGPVAACVDDDGALVEFTFLNGVMSNHWANDGQALQAPSRLAHIEHQIADFFAGKRQSFDLVLAPRGTPFQQRVWRALCDIPFGTTISYLTLATWLGDPKATRAVGAANGRNPIALIIPCHRVIGSNGQLTGYGGGLDLKRGLLDFETPKLL